MMIRSFFLTVYFYQRYKFFDTEVVTSLGVFAPVTGCFFTHEVHSYDGFYNFILNNSKCLSLFLPRCTGNLFKFFFEFFKSALVIQLAFKFRKIRNRTAVSLHLIEHLHKYFHNCLFAGSHFCRTFGINIKEHDIRRNSTGISHLGNEHRIFNFFAICKVLNGSLSLYDTVFQQVRKDL